MENHFDTIDIHAHIGHFEGYDLSVRTLLDELERGGIALALVSNIDGAQVDGKTRGLDETEANRATEAVVRSYPDRLRGLLWGRPDIGDSSRLRAFLSSRIEADRRRAEGPWTDRLFVGLKLHPEMNHFQADAPALDPYMELARDAGFPVVFHSDGQVDRASPQRIVALAERFPNVPVVLYHTAFQGPYSPAIERVGEVLDADGAELYLETSQLPASAAIEAVERVGARRVLFGTDATYYGAGHYDRYRELRDALDSHLSSDDLRAIMSDNARHLFRLAKESGSHD